MSSDPVRVALTLGAAMSMGHSAGIIQLFAHTIMPGLRTLDDRTFVASFQAIDRKIINPWFLGGTFFGALVLTGCATAANRGEAPFWWTAGALAAHGVTVATTMAINVPLNNAVTGAGDPNVIDVARVRARFSENRWRAANRLRLVTTTGAFASLAWALVLCGRST